MITYKFLFDIILSVTYNKFIGIEIKLFYLNTSMDQYDYMILPIYIIPKEIIREYQLMDKVKIGSSFLKSDRECIYFHRQGLLQTNYSRRGF